MQIIWDEGSNLEQGGDVCVAISDMLCDLKSPSF